VEALSDAAVEGFDDLGVVLRWSGADRGMRVPLVRGVPYATFELNNLTPNISTSAIIVEPRGRAVGDRFTIKFNSGEAWTLYASESLELRVVIVSAPNGTLLGSHLLARRPMTGVLRLARAPPEPEQAALLDAYADVYPVGGDVRAYYAGAPPLLFRCLVVQFWGGVAGRAEGSRRRAHAHQGGRTPPPLTERLHTHPHTHQQAATATCASATARPPCPARCRTAARRRGCCWRRSLTTWTASLTATACGAPTSRTPPSGGL